MSSRSATQLDSSGRASAVFPGDDAPNPSCSIAAFSISRDKALLNANDNATVRSPLGPLGAKRSSHSLFSGWSKGARPWLSLIHNIKSFSTSSALMSGSTPDCCVTDSPSLLRRSAASAGVSAEHVTRPSTRATQAACRTLRRVVVIFAQA